MININFTLRGKAHLFKPKTIGQIARSVSYSDGHSSSELGSVKMIPLGPWGFPRPKSFMFWGQ